ncbi:MAG: DUF3450 family protein [Deltaproteobacteria bacterium]|nr:DUF3450 family protein [Deltaproteobacteria bacterium]
MSDRSPKLSRPEFLAHLSVARRSIVCAPRVTAASVFVLFGTTLLASVPVHAEPPDSRAVDTQLNDQPSHSTSDDGALDEMAIELSRLRAEVETLTETLDEKKDDELRQVRALDAQKLALEADVQRETLRLKELQAAEDAIKKRIESAGAFERSLKPAVLEGVSAVEAAVRGGLPFRVDDRLTDLQRLKSSVEDGTIAPSAAVSRLWSQVEDELRLGRENGLHQQVIRLSGQDVLADVARLGMVMLYFQTPDGRVGSAVLGPEGWRYRVFQDPTSRAQVEDLFESLKKRARVGFFELPNPSVLETENK